MADISELMRRMAEQMMSGSNAGPEARRAGANVPGAYKSNTNRSLPPEILQALLAGSRGPQVNPSAGVGSPSSALDITPQRAANRPADWHWNEGGQVGKFDSAQAEAMANRIMDDDSSYETETFGKILRKDAPTTPHPAGSGRTPDLQDRVSGHNPGDNRNVVGHFGHERVVYEDGSIRERCIRPDLGCDVGMDVGKWYSL